MGQSIQKVKLIGGMNVDVAETHLKATESRYNLNLERSVNSGRNGGMGNNMGKNTPSPANRALTYIQPAGDNLVCGRCESKKTSEVYVMVWNSLLNHHIYRINADNTTELVLLDLLLPFSNDPKYYIAPSRSHLFYNHNSFQEQSNGIFRKYLTWVNGLYQCFVDVETAIATNGFRVAYFSTADRTQFWQMATRPPLKCITAEFIPVNPDDEEERSAANLLKEKSWQFRQQFIYTDGRPTAWSPISATYLLETSVCQATAEGLPRCFKLKIDAGGPQVEKIVIAFRNCAGNFTSIEDPDWYETETIEKYAECLDSDISFYERALRDDLNYDVAGNTFDYIFCNTGKCIPINKKETDRNYNDVPVTSWAQVPLDDRLSYINNSFGFDKLDCDLAEKISFTAVEPDQTECQNEMVTIKVSVLIHNIWRHINEPIFVFEDVGLLNGGKKKCFGGLAPNTSLGPFSIATPFDDPTPYQQVFGDDSVNAGFICYVDGTDNFGVTKQYKYDGSTYELYTPGNFHDNYIRRRRSKELTDNDLYYIQTAEIKVFKGTKGFIRLSSHKSQVTDDYKNTSTTVMGVYRNRQGYSAHSDVNEGNCDFLQKEIYFDACEGDVDLSNTPFIVADLTGPFSDYKVFIPPWGIWVVLENLLFGTSATAFCGYLKDALGRPVEHAETVPFGGQRGSYTGHITDHNGFYFCSELFGNYTIMFNGSGVDFYVEGPGCAKVHGANYDYGKGDRPNLAVYSDVKINDVVDYDIKYFTSLQINLKDNNGVPIPGIYIALAGRQAKQTTSAGYATFLVRNDMFRYGTAMNLRAIVMQSGLCNLTQADCEDCMPEIDVPFSACFPTAIILQIIDQFPTFSSPGFTKGWHPGGKYPLALKFMDPQGRETFARECGSVQLPSIQQMQRFVFPTITWAITGAMQLPAEFTKMAILIGKNINLEDFMCWVVDRVEFVDGGGGIASKDSADKILLSVRSLFDYNMLYAFGTNAKYTFVPGDKIEIIANADGTIFAAPVSGLTFNIEADHHNREAVLADEKDRYSKLVISYSKNLSELTAGAQIKLIRPRQCDNEQFYYETCALIDLLNGEPVTTSGSVSGFDSYFVRRAIRWTDIAADGVEGLPMTHSFSFPFLHHSPSDFWGDHCIDRGRISVVNKNEKRMQYGRMMRISQAWLQNGNFNGLSVFTNEFSKSFTGEQRGDIVTAISTEQVFMMICEHDNFIANAADGFVRLDPRTQQVVANSPDQVVSDAQSKIVGNFGCQYDDVACALAGDGWVFWMDSYNKAPVLHNWQQAKDVSVDMMSSYFVQKLLYKNQYNAGVPPEKKMRIVSGLDPVNGNIMVTFFKPPAEAAVTTIPPTTTIPATTTPVTTIPPTTIPVTTIPPTTIPATTIPATTTIGIATLTFYTNMDFFPCVGAKLNVPLSVDITITRMFSDGYDTDTCTSEAIGSLQQNNDQPIPAGNLDTGCTRQIMTGDWSTAIAYTMYNCNVNGAAVYDGEVLHLDGVDVTVIIPVCAGVPGTL